jgi:hypothetical protein
MSEQEFATWLQTLFAKPAPFADAPDFVRRTQQRLRKRRRTRLAVLGISGVAAGAVSLHALIASGIAAQLGRALDLLLKASGGFGIYWTAIGILVLLALALFANLDDGRPLSEGTSPHFS